MRPEDFTIDPTGEKKVILSIDGGGMRGTIPIAMLAELEAQTGKTCQEMFDMVAGTSTGAIIAVGLATGMSATQILEEVYLDRLPKAFGATSPRPLPHLLARFLAAIRLIGAQDVEFAARLFSTGLRHAYPLEPFLASLRPFVGCKKVGELRYPENPILLVTTKDVQSGATCFIVNAGKGRQKFEEWPLTGVVAASGAAPIFFPPVLERLIDGGVGMYSNPCLAASIEAMEYISPELPEFQDGNVIHISLGTGYVENGVKDGGVRDYRLLDWLRYVIAESLDDAAFQQVFTTRALYGRIKTRAGRTDFRRYNPLLTADSVRCKLDIALDDGQDPAHLGLDSYRPEQVKLMERIGREYARRICWSQPDIMPWETIGGQSDPDTVDEGDLVWQAPYVCEADERVADPA